jgi:glycerol-3-phosphate acyltransferase PlsY
MLQAVLVVVGCYLIGAVPFAIIVSRLVKGIDLREHGSGNMGAMNAARVLGKQWFPVVFVLDFAKGAAVVLLARLLLPGLLDIAPDLAAALGAIAAVVGHCFPIYVGFKGGVGLATSAGAVALIHPFLLLGVLAAMGLFWLLAKNLYAGTAAGAATAPIFAWFLFHDQNMVVAITIWAAVLVGVHMKDVNRWLALRRAR